MEYLTMNRKEREQAKVFEQVKQGIITQIEAATRLRITDRWVREKIKRFYESGDAGLIHKSRGKQSHQKWSLQKECVLIEHLQGEWAGFGPTFAAEKLEELYGIKVSNETVRRSMIRASLWQPKQRRRKHRQRRERKSMLGMMVQVDGSSHDWFEGRAPRCTLLVFIDDATSRILWLEFAKSESEKASMRATKSYIQAHGIPGAFYTDHGAVFHVNLNNQEHDKKTQWERACGRLNIQVMHAHSPQAKGRVERCNGTLQDRLIKEMRLAGISSIEAANEYLQASDFIEQHNAKFACKPAQQGDAHADWKAYNLDDIFSVHEVRVLANDFTILYQKRIFQLHNQQKTIIRPKDALTIKISLEGKISLWIRNTKLKFNEISERPKKAIKEKTVIDRVYKPSENSKKWFNRPFSESRVKPAAPAVEAL